MLKTELKNLSRSPHFATLKKVLNLGGPDTIK